MTVLELAIFMAVYRASAPTRLSLVSGTLAGWFEQDVAGEEVERAIEDMMARGWLTASGRNLHAAEKGRRVACRLLNGIIRMLDQGTRLIDVALMMAVLRLTKGELDRGADHS